MEIYFKYVKILVKSQMVYKKSFIMLCIGQFFVPFYVFLALLILFRQFGSLIEWQLHEVALIYGVIHLAFAISESLLRGFDSFSSLIVKGEFDRIMVRPRSSVLQVMGSKLELTRIGRVLQGGAVLAWALWNVNVEWNPLKGAAVLFMIVGGVCIFAGIFIIFASMCFWTVQGLEVANIFTDGGREMSQYPLTIYHKWIRNFFTYVVPFGIVNYLPLKYILGKAGYQSPFWAFVPLMGILFLIPSLMIWRLGVSRYQSTGS